MQQIINFVIRNKTALLFLLLFGISVALTIQSHSFHRSKFISSANFFTGGIYEGASGISDYFNLRSENKVLLAENERLKSLLYNSQDKDTTFIDTSYSGGKYKMISASVNKNSYSATSNYLTINKGKNDGIKEDFGVITSEGLIGIVENVSNNYASVISILNPKSQINATLNNSDHIGSLIWNGKSPHYVQLKDISKFAEIKNGDTISTGGQSSIFPKGIAIGTIVDFSSDISGDSYIINVRLFKDMTNVGHVYVIENLDIDEIKSLELGLDE